MKNIIKYISIVFIFFFTCLNSINAAVVLGEGVTFPIGGGYSDYTTAPFYVSGNNDVFTYGIRISLITSEGKTVISRNYFSTDIPNSSNIQILGSCNKVMYSSGTCAYSSSNWHSITSDYYPVSQLDAIFRSVGLSTNISGNIKSQTGFARDTMFASLNTQNATKTKSAFNKLLEGTGTTIDDYKVNDAYNLFLEWEPLGKVNFSNAQGTYSYIGTTYELTNLLLEFKGTYVSPGCANISSETGLFCDLGKPVGQSLGCAVYLDGSIGGRVNQVLKNNAFVGNSYFNGNLTINWGTSQCSNGSYTGLVSSASDSHTSSGVGIIWLNDIVSPGLSCEEIYSFYGGKESPDSPYTKLYINNESSFNFSKFNSKYKKNVTTEWFRVNCPYSPEPTPGLYNCTPQYNVPSCTEGNDKTLVYKDANPIDGTNDTYWNNCVFDDSKGYYEITPHKTSVNNKPTTYREDSLGSNYCEVYCIEETYANFDSNNPTVLAGSHFVWGWSTVNSSRTCKTKSIDYSRFLSDLKKANEAVLMAQAIQELNSLHSSGYWKEGDDTTKNGDKCLSYNNKTKVCESWEQVYDCTEYSWESGSDKEKYTVSSSDSNGLSTPSPQTAKISLDTCVDKNSPPSGAPEAYPSSNNSSNNSGDNSSKISEYQKKISEAEEIIKIYYDEISYLKEENYNNEIAQLEQNIRYLYNQIAIYQAEINKLQADNQSNSSSNTYDLEAAKKKVQEIIEKMKKCYTWNESNIYNDASTATMTYNSDVYNYSAQMAKDLQYTATSIFNDCISTTETSLNSCSGAKCSGTSTMQKCSKYEATRGANVSFSLQSGIFDIVLKNPNGLTLKSIHSKDLNNYISSDKFTINYLNIGYSNFPVPYYLSNGTYQGTLNIAYSNLGHKGSSDKTAVDTILSTLQKSEFVYGNYGDWSCGYTVSGKTGCIIDCDEKPGDINVIYREIDLYHPFPDIDSSNRATGANWCDRYDCAWNNAVSKQYILQNRNVTGDDLYDLEPMYTFIMTPSDIIQIRRYNDENTYTSYTGSYSGKNYDFKCITGTGRGCRSEYLTELMNMMDTSSYSGTCKTERTVYPTISQFESCRYGTNQ